MRSGRKMLVSLSALVLFLLTAVPAASAATTEPAAPERDSVSATELPGSGPSPMLLAAIGGYLLTGGLALLLLRR
ncbi:hypothetical protein [Actinoplanes sp. GCM10030250]|uniref:hypothetical protein n=1 Tax=Actinoplanes sp. GCM10030250 TaxID=3273376 RepID=UPI00360EC8FA